MTITDGTTLPFGLNRLLTESRHLRDHMLRAEKLDALPLTTALLPFDHVDDISKLKNGEIETLSTAFQAALDKAHLVIDRRTMDNILSGRSPLVAPKGARVKLGVFANNAAQSIITLVLVFAAFHYSTWISKSSKMIVNAEQFLAFDNTQSTNSMIELERAFLLADSGTGRTKDSIITEYVKQAKVLEDQYLAELNVTKSLDALNSGFHPIKRTASRIKDFACSRVEPITDGQERFGSHLLLNCPVETTAPVEAYQLPAETRAAVVCLPNGACVSDTNSDPDTPTTLREALRSLEADRQALMIAAGRVPMTTYRQTRNKVLEQMEPLVFNLEIARSWILPIIFGALGSCVYSMSCMLNSNVSSHTILYSLIRMIFGGLAAVTLSTLIVPSNVVSVGAELNRPFMYLLSFIFGFSIETFINMLNRINHSLSENFAIKKS